MVHMYNGILLSYEKELNCAICRGRDGLGTVIQSEVSQKEKKANGTYIQWNITQL